MTIQQFGSINVGKIYESDERAKVEFYLGHSCDEWVIGSLEEAKKFSADLLEAIKYYEENV